MARSTDVRFCRYLCLALRLAATPRGSIVWQTLVRVMNGRLESSFLGEFGKQYETGHIGIAR